MRHDFDSFTIWIAAQHVPGDGERRLIRVINLVNERVTVLNEKLDQVHALQSHSQVQDGVALFEFLEFQRKREELASNVFHTKVRRASRNFAPVKRIPESTTNSN